MGKLQVYPFTVVNDLRGGGSLWFVFVGGAYAGVQERGHLLLQLAPYISSWSMYLAEAVGEHGMEGREIGKEELLVSV